MNLDRFIREREPAWNELRGLVADAGGRVERLGPDRIRRLGALYRATAADLALARRRFPTDPAAAGLEELVGRARHLVYATEARRASVGAFLSRGYWRRVADRPALLLLAAVLLLAPAVLGAVWGADDPVAAERVVPGQLAGAKHGHGDGSDADLGLTAGDSTALSTQIFTNNIRVTFLALAGGMTAGILTAASLLYNGLILGVVAGRAASEGASSRFVQLVVPHGVLELSCIVVAGAAGLRLAAAILAPGRRRRRDALRREARPAVEMALGTALWLVVAGLVEGFVTPTGVGVGPALAVGLGFGGLYWWLVWWRGRRALDPALTAAPETST